MVPRTGATSARPPRPGRRCRTVVRARTIAPSAPADLPALPGLARRLDPRRCLDRFVAQPVALEADEHALVLAPATRRLERLEIERQVLLEVVVEGRPAVADPAGQPRPGRRLATDDDRRRRVRDGVGGRLVQRVERRLARDRAAGPHRADDRDGLLEARHALGRRREVDAVGLVLLGGATDADAEDKPPAAQRSGGSRPSAPRAPGAGS